MSMGRTRLSGLRTLDKALLNATRCFGVNGFLDARASRSSWLFLARLFSCACWFFVSLGPALGGTFGPTLGGTFGPTLGGTLDPFFGGTFGPPLGDTFDPFFGGTLDPFFGGAFGPSLGDA